MKNQKAFALFGAINLLALLIACGKEPRQESPVPGTPPTTGQPTGTKEVSLRSAAPEKAAEFGLKELIRLSSYPETMARAGFGSMDEVKKAQLGKPFSASLLSCEAISIKSAVGQNFPQFLVRTQWLFPVIVDEKMRSAVYVDSIPEKGIAGDWVVTAVGEAGIVRAYDSARVRFNSKATEKQPDLFMVPSAGLGFAATGMKPSDLVLQLTGSKPIPCLEKVKKPITWKEMIRVVNACKLVQPACMDTKALGLPPGTKSVDPKD